MKRQMLGLANGMVSISGGATTRLAWACVRASWHKFNVIMFDRAKQIQTMCCVFLEGEQKVLEEGRET
jgi:hypothetical protein